MHFSSMSNSKVTGGRFLPQASDCHRHTFLLPAAPMLVLKPQHHNGSRPLHLSSRSFTVHASSRLPSTQARRLKFLSRTGHPLHWIERAGRTIGSIFATSERTSVDENASQHNVERMARIRNQLLRPKLSPSSYDTAWVAMVPSPSSSHIPCFPQCVEWILQNQESNGSWGHSQVDSSVNKDVLSSTLACVLALTRWNVGREHIMKGLYFIGRNFYIAMDEQTAPIGFNVIFPGMLNLATRMGLEVPTTQTHMHGILHLREMELERLAGDKSFGKEAYMAYISEGIGDLLDWNRVMKLQRQNGSLFNSPSATAAAVIYNNDDKALQYLNLLVGQCGSSVPTVYPENVYCQLSMVDSLEKIGILHHFCSEIKTVLDVTYSLWVEGDEEIMNDVTTCAMAFRLLRMNGYDVSSDELRHVGEASTFKNSLQGYLNDTKSILELYKASELNVLDNEFILDKIGCWSCKLLMEKLLSDGVQSRPIFSEVDYALKFPSYATMDRLVHKRNIENFDAKDSRLLKTEHLPCCVNQDVLGLAIEDFSLSQSIYQEELLILESWVTENKLDQLQFARQKLAYCYVSAAAAIFHPELSDARISWTKNSILVTVVDDFFDVAGSKEELENLVALIERWDEHSPDGFYSEQVKTLFYAIYTTVNQLGVIASSVQSRDVRKHLIELWIQQLRSSMTEAEWQTRQYVPKMEEYLENSIVSLGGGPIVLIASYFLRRKLLAYIVKHQEYNELYRLMGTCGRLLNDIQGFERESSEGKLGSVSLLILHSDGSMSIGAAKDSIRRTIASCRKDLLRLVIKEDSVVPPECRELFWKMCKICHFFYSHTDAFTSPSEMVSAVNAVIHEPLKLQIGNSCSHMH